MSKYNVVFHVDSADSALALALHNYENYVAALTEERFTAVLVANAAAVTLLKCDNEPLRGAIEQAAATGLEIRVCRNALNSNGIRPEELYPQCEVVPAGVVEIVRLQSDGFAYVKP